MYIGCICVYDVGFVCIYDTVIIIVIVPEAFEKHMNRQISYD